MKLIFDLETNGLLPELHTIHCMEAKDVDTGQRYSFGPDDRRGAVHLLFRANTLIGHNILTFDLPALKKVWNFEPTKFVELRDTLVMSRLLFPDLKDRDFRYLKHNTEYPKNLIGSHGLKAWGHRILEYKDAYDGGWENWSQDMQDYCKQDVNVTALLWDKLLSKKPSAESLELEHQVASILWRQENHGFSFDKRAASALLAHLVQRRADLHADLDECFPPWEVQTPFLPKRDNKTLGYKKGVSVFKKKTVTFNPNSRDHIAEKLKEKYSWKPKEYTPEGKAKVDETTLRPLAYPEAQLLCQSFLVQKRIGQLSEGPQAWLKVEKAGVIHGRVNHNGAVTGRMTHSKPNMAQVPSARAVYGEECRALFVARPGTLLVGCDADSLELRCLAGYMANWDDGAYIETILKGDKSDGSDMHSQNAAVLKCSRDVAKTWFYAFIYGAGDTKLGDILGSGNAHGKKSRTTFLKSLPALARLIGAVQARASKRGHLKGLDARALSVRSHHAALNTLLQSAGAVLMKKALCLLDDRLQSEGVTYEFVANVHDELQIEVKKGREEDVGKEAVAAIRRAGEHYKYGGPLGGHYTVGQTLADTH